MFIDLLKKLWLSLLKIIYKRKNKIVVKDNFIQLTDSELTLYRTFVKTNNIMCTRFPSSKYIIYYPFIHVYSLNELYELIKIGLYNFGFNSNNKCVICNCICKWKYCSECGSNSFKRKKKSTITDKIFSRWKGYELRLVKINKNNFNKDKIEKEIGLFKNNPFYEIFQIINDPIYGIHTFSYLERERHYREKTIKII